ncbi:MAG TPA: hypothetical protein VGO31_01055 [Microbacteriaceae bacterium]|jgi:hypothetical protein|nr:hypothetical protein [Microbacteriaceae bacterium]
MNTATHKHTPSTLAPDRLALEAYAERLERHHTRLIDDLDAARLRIQWTEHERLARLVLNAADARALEDVGILAAPTDDLEDRRLIMRRRIQLAALAAVQALTAEAVRSARLPADRAEGRQ